MRVILVLAIAQDVVLFGDMDVHYLGDGSQIRISLAADDEMVSWQERLVHARILFSRSERGSDARGHQLLPFEDSMQPSAAASRDVEGSGRPEGSGGRACRPTACAFMFQWWSSFP